MHIHRRTQDTLAECSQTHGACQVIRDSVCDLADDVRRCRHHTHHICPLREIHMRDGILRVVFEQRCQHRPVTEGLKGERRDKLRGVFRHHHPDLMSGLRQPARQITGFVRRDPARHDNQNMLGFHEQSLLDPFSISINSVYSSTPAKHKCGSCPREADDGLVRRYADGEPAGGQTVFTGIHGLSTINL